MNKILLYLNERFPIVPVLLFSLGYASLATGVSEIQPNNQLQTILILSGVFLFFLLRQRVVDEFKDSSHDLKNFPNRPIPRGLISKNQLMLLGFLALFFEWSFVYILGVHSLLMYIPVFIYSLLMAKEFFISDWLNSQFNLYLISHEVIFLFFGLYFVGIVNGSLETVANLPLRLLILFVAPFSIEVGRKFSPRYDKKGKAVRDTYSTVWGRNVAIGVMLTSALLTGFFLTLIKNNYLPLGLSVIISLVFIVFGKKSDKIVIVSGAINFLGLAILSNIIW